MKFIQHLALATQSNILAHIPVTQTVKKPAHDLKAKKSVKKHPKISRWTPEENVLYLRFLKHNQDKFTGKCPKKFLKFQKMSFEIDSKTPDQCRSHHQKMMMRFKSIENIIRGKASEQQSEVDNKSEKSYETEFAAQKMAEENSQLQIHTSEAVLKKIQSISSSFSDKNLFLDQHLFDVLFEEAML